MTIYKEVLRYYLGDKILGLDKDFRKMMVLSSLKKRLHQATFGLKAILKPEKTPPNRLSIKDKICFYAETKNQYDALFPIYEKMENAVFMTNFGLIAHERYSPPFPDKVPFYFVDLSKTRQILWKMPFHFLALVLYSPRKMYYNFSNFVLGYGKYETYIQLLQSEKPKAVVLSNDHNTSGRALMLAAKTTNIPSIYVQHAAVSDIFPPLSFDLSLLDGQASHDIYAKLGNISGKVSLIGIGKFDAYYHLRNKNEQVKSLVVAFNALDSIDLIADLIQKIRTTFPTLQVYVRPHPRDKRDLQQLKDLGVNISLSHIENTFDFLQKVDMLICQNSGIHLDATTMNVVSVYYHLNPAGIYDYYGFVKNGMIAEAKDWAELKAIIQANTQHKAPVSHLAKYYNEAINTPFEGNSTQKCVSEINDFVAKWGK